MRPGAAAAAFLGLFVICGASAQTRPPLIPTRDVDVTYRVTQAGRTLDERVRWLADQQLQRVDSSGPVYMIVDHKARHLTLVNTAKRTVLAMEAPRQSALNPDSDAGFTNSGQDNAAGLPCTQWRMAAAGAAKQLCVTADGVMLRVQDGGTTVAEATTVQYGPVDPASFRVPTDFQSVSPPAAPAPVGPGTPPSQ